MDIVPDISCSSYFPVCHRYSSWYSECNPSFINLQKGSAPDTEGRSAYNSYTSTVESDGANFTAMCTQLLDYAFVYENNEGNPEALRLERACRMKSKLSASAKSAYTIAQAGNSLKNGMIYKLDSYEDWYAQKARTVEGFTRQAKEVFPARITKLSCKLQNSEIQGVCGLSNGTLDQSSRINGSISPFVDVETQSSPRLLSYMCIDNQFADSDTDTTYGRPYIVTTGVTEVEFSDKSMASYIDIELTGVTDQPKRVAWPRSVNWATGKFAGGQQLLFIYSAYPARYAITDDGGAIVPGPSGGYNYVDWGGHMHFISSDTNSTPSSRLMCTSTPEVRGSSTTSYFFADVRE